MPLDYGSTLAFFERRAERSAGQPAITVTSYQDQDPDLARRRDEAEWARIEAWLRLDRRPIALDVGCGVGRWARHLVGRVDRYVGVDFSPGLVELANSTLLDLGASNAHVQVLGAAEVGTTTLDDPGPFGLVVISGVLTYLNDDDAARCLRGVAAVVAEDSVVYLREPVAVERRLTLRDHWSNDLADKYSAVYRDVDNYRSWLQEALGLAGFVVVYDEPLDATLQNRRETSQHFFVLDRRARQGT